MGWHCLVAQPVKQHIIKGISSSWNSRFFSQFDIKIIFKLISIVVFGLTKRFRAKIKYWNFMKFFLIYVEGFYWKSGQKSSYFKCII